MSESEAGYVNFFEILGLEPDTKPGEVRKVYRRMMKDLVMEIAQTEITEDRRARYLLEMAKLNAALYVLRETDQRDEYWRERLELIALEEEWRNADRDRPGETNALRRKYDGLLRSFLGKYIEETMLVAGRDKECVENSHWDEAHERHASRLIRQFRARLHQQILQRLPFVEVTRPDIDWKERRSNIKRILAEVGRE